MKNCKNAIWETIDLFDAFSIGVIPGDWNEHTDVLVVVVATLQPCDEMLRFDCKMKVVFRPVVTNNVDN